MKPTQTTGQTLDRQKPKRRKNSTEGWEKETSNTVSFLKNNEKAEKYHTNEGTN